MNSYEVTFLDKCNFKYSARVKAVTPEEASKFINSIVDIQSIISIIFIEKVTD